MTTQNLLNFVLAACLFSFTACNSEKEDNTVPEGMVDVAKNMNFVFTAEAYNDDITATRSFFEPEAPADTVDLGNGLTAEVSVERDKPVYTRADKPMSDGRYVIYAIGSDEKIIPGKLVKGWVKNNKFTHDAGSHLYLTAGQTYGLLCLSEQISEFMPGGEIFMVVNGQNGLAGRTNVTISADNNDIIFHMKHLFARMRFKLTAYSEKLENAKADIAAGLDIGQTWMGFNTKLEYVMGDYYPSYSACTFPVASTTMSTEFPLAHEFMSDYTYVVPEPSQAVPSAYVPTPFIRNCKITFTSGKLYGKDLKDVVLTNFKSTQKLKPNDSYTVNIKITTNPLYLCKDGSVRALPDIQSSQPAVGLVITEKTKNQKGMAAGINTFHSDWEHPIEENVKKYSSSITIHTSIFDALGDENGYNYTYTAATDVDGKVKGNEQTQYPTFYYAAHYETGTGREWYFPAVGEMMKLIDKMLTITAKDPDGSGGVNYYNFTVAKEPNVLTKAFADVGGNATLSTRTWTSTLCDERAFYYNPIVVYELDSKQGYFRVPGGGKRGDQGTKVIPFVRF